MAKREHWLTYDSTVGELYDNPVGHDALAKVLLQLGLPEKVLTNRVISGLTLRTIARLAKGKLGMDFFDSLLGLVELEKDKPCASKGENHTEMVERGGVLSDLSPELLRWQWRWDRRSARYYQQAGLFAEAGGGRALALPHL